MVTRPIYHITHLNNLAGIIHAGHLLSDCRVRSEGTNQVIGFDHIKNRRMEIEVQCHPGTMLGDYVPFYFCPRSVMLYVIECRHDELQYKGGQREIVHLVSSIEAAIIAAGERPWAYSDGNAAAAYSRCYADLSGIDDKVDWTAVNAKYWSEPAVKSNKQAEFLVHDHCSWSVFDEIGVFDEKLAAKVQEILQIATHRPVINVRKNWYY